MKNLTRRNFVQAAGLGTAAASLMGLAACGGNGSEGGADAPAVTKDTVTMISMVENASFSPFSKAGTDKPVQHALFDDLFQFDNDGNVINKLVESYEEDGLVKTLKLREDVKFTSGNPLTADDVVWCYNKAVSDEQSGPFLLTYIAAMEKVDDYTIKITVGNPLTKWKNYLAEYMPIVEAASFDETSDYVDAAPVGSGAYTLASVDNARTVTMVANEDYWNGAPAIKTAIVKAPVDGSTALVALQNGEADIVSNLPEDQVVTAREDANLAITDFDSWSCQLMGSYVADEKFRQACFHAINPQNIIDIANNGIGTPATNMLSKKTMGDYAGISSFTGYDLELAKQLIAESSADLTKTYQLITFDSEKAAQCIQQDLKAIGVNVEVSLVDINTFSDQLYSGNLELFLIGLGTDVQDLTAFLQLLFGPASVYQYPVSDEFKAKVATLGEDVAAEKDPSDSVKAVLDAMAVECPIVPLYDINYHDAYVKGLQGVQDHSAATYVYYMGDYSWGA